MRKQSERRLERKMGSGAVIALVLAATAGPVAAQMKVEATSPNGETTLIVELDVKPGFEAEFEQTFRRSVRCSRLEPGNILFNLHKIRGQSSGYLLYEIWRSPEALTAHFERPYTKALFKMFDRALVKPVTHGGLRFISEMEPARRSAPVTGDPSSVAECT